MTNVDTSLKFKIGSLLIPLIPLVIVGYVFIKSIPKNTVAHFFPPSIQYWAKNYKIADWANEVGLDQNLVATVMTLESCGNPEALSSAGAEGLFQVMPYHFNPGVDTTDPDINARTGLAYLVESIDAHNGDIRLGLAGYNAGITGSKSTPLPAETQVYLHYGMGILEDALANKTESMYLKEWMRKGGQNFCMRAEIALELR